MAWSVAPTDRGKPGKVEGLEPEDLLRSRSAEPIRACGPCRPRTRPDTCGRTVRRGGITKAGNALARRVLIEGAWTYRLQARISRKLHDRIEQAPSIIRDIAWKAQLRLCGRYRHLVAAGKAKVVVTTAIAREMVGFIWAIARQV